jgi:hypothetical protein
MAAEHSAFISYSRADSEFALRLARDLKAAGARVWLDQIDIVPGASWDNAVETALMAAEYMLLILSPASAKSDNVRDEVSYALENGKTVIPVLYMDCVIPLRLQRKQRIDFRADYGRGLSGLLDQLRVENPNQAVVQKAVEDDAVRQAAWQAREAEARRIAERKERERQEEAARATEAARQKALVELAAQEKAERVAKEEAEQRSRQEAEQRAAAEAERLKALQQGQQAGPGPGPTPAPAPGPLPGPPGVIPIVVAPPASKKGGWLGIIAGVCVLAGIAYYYSKPNNSGGGGGGSTPPASTLVQQQAFTGHWEAENGEIMVTSAQWTNNSAVTIVSATLECVQYDASGNQLTEVQTVLTPSGPLQPKGTSVFDAFQIGVVVPNVTRVNCFIVNVTPAG